LKQHWHWDDAAERVLNANPTNTTNFLGGHAERDPACACTGQAASKLMGSMQRLGVAEARQLLSRFNHDYPLQHAQ
jgi:hypothetical protein